MTRELRNATLVAWGLASTVFCLIAARAIAGLQFPDPDDVMRLLEARDWIAGQGFWDVSQHRLVGPTGAGVFAMHWSRIVDVPIAAILLLAAPLGDAAATRIVLVAVPLMTLLVVMLLLARLTETLAGTERAKLSALVAALSPPLVFQIHPMRIDHHGWQVALALAAMLALVSTPVRRSGAIAGLALAALVCISLEGVMITAAIVGVALLAWAWAPERRGQAAALLATFSVGTFVIHAVQRGPAMLAPACDAIAPAWIAAIATAAAIAGLTLWRARTFAFRVGGVIAAGIAAAIVVKIAAPVCARGPFASLDPLTYRLWYLNVAEGLPAWAQSPETAFLDYALPVVGIGGSVVALRASAAEARLRWAMLLGIAVAAFVFSVLVARGAATANAFAIPGATWLLHAWLGRARAIPRTLPRIGATAAALVCTAPGLVAAPLVEAAASAQAEARVRMEAAGGLPQCRDKIDLAALGRLPTGLVYAPLDVSPALLATTPHRAIASGYHRNATAIRAVMLTFIGTPEHARAAVLASGADYVAGCSGETETELYKHEAPDGFWARLERGERFDWLRRVPLAGSPVLVWRVVRPRS